MVALPWAPHLIICRCRWRFLDALYQSNFIVSASSARWRTKFPTSFFIAVSSHRLHLFSLSRSNSWSILTFFSLESRDFRFAPHYTRPPNGLKCKPPSSIYLENLVSHTFDSFSTRLRGLNFPVSNLISLTRHFSMHLVSLECLFGGLDRSSSRLWLS